MIRKARVGYDRGYIGEIYKSPLLHEWRWDERGESNVTNRRCGLAVATTECQCFSRTAYSLTLNRLFQ